MSDLTINLINLFVGEKIIEEECTTVSNIVNKIEFEKRHIKSEEKHKVILYLKEKYNKTLTYKNDLLLLLECERFAIIKFNGLDLPVKKYVMKKMNPRPETLTFSKIVKIKLTNIKNGKFYFKIRCPFNEKKTRGFQYEIYSDFINFYYNVII